MKILFIILTVIFALFMIAENDHKPRFTMEIGFIVSVVTLLVLHFN